MSAPSHAFQHYPSPFDVGCARCSYPRSAHPKTEPSPRDPATEQDFLEAALALAEKLIGRHHSGYIAQVRKRLAIGAERYGDGAFLERDNLVEIREETPDLGSYPVLEYQRMLAAGEDTAEDKADLLAIAAHGACADIHAQRILDRRRDG